MKKFGNIIFFSYLNRRKLKTMKLSKLRILNEKGRLLSKQQRLLKLHLLLLIMSLF